MGSHAPTLGTKGERGKVAATMRSGKAAAAEGDGARGLEKLRGFDRRRAARLNERPVKRPVGQFIRKPHAHAVMFGPHDDGIGDRAAIMDFAARARGHTGPVDPRSALRQVADPAVDEVEHTVDGDLDRSRGALVAAGGGGAETVHGRDATPSW